jgi:hypothetical protein
MVMLRSTINADAAQIEIARWNSSAIGLGRAPALLTGRSALAN